MEKNLTNEQLKKMEQKYSHEQIDALNIINQLYRLKRENIRVIEFCEDRNLDHPYHDGLCDAFDIAIGYIAQTFSVEGDI